VVRNNGHHAKVWYAIQTKVGEQNRFFAFIYISALQKIDYMVLKAKTFFVSISLDTTIKELMEEIWKR
jgi:hypothetical protein